MSDRALLDAMANRLADVLGVDPEDIATYPRNGHIGLTVDQVRRLLEMKTS